MSAVAQKNVFVGAPDQRTTGAILTGEADREPPESIGDDVPNSAEASGYVGEEGVTIAPERSTEDIRDWSGSVIRKILTEFDGTVSWEHLELSIQALKNYFGEDNVSVTEATSSSGTQTKSVLNGEELPVKSWYFKMKDGPRRILIFIPRGQVTEQGEIQFVKTEAVKLPVVLSTYPDEEGNNIYIYTDDGVYSSSDNGGGTEGSTSTMSTATTASTSASSTRSRGGNSASSS